MKIVRHASVIALLTGLCSIAHAFELGGSSVDAGHVSFGGRATYFDAIDSDDNHLYGGAQLRWFMSPALAIEGSADYRRADYGDTDVHVYPVQASMLFNLIPNKPVSPFLLAGAGWYYTTTKEASGHEDTQQRFGPHAGAGIMAFLNKYFSIDAAYRYVWVEKIETHNSALEDKEYKDSGHMFTAGLNYHF